MVKYLQIHDGDFAPICHEKIGMRCCVKATKFINACPATPTQKDIIYADPPLNVEPKKSPPTGSESDLRVGIKNHCLVGVSSSYMDSLPGANRWAVLLHYS